jgi:prepilin-type N-terminal cleavage/methylation domain-containing protein
MRKKKSFTLLELMIVVIVLGIIASFVIPGYFGVQRKAREREAKAMLGLILTKQKSLHLETGQYTGCSDTADCNDKLDLDLPPRPKSYWIYSVPTPAGTGPAAFCAQAEASGDGWRINQGLDDAEEGLCQ